MVKLMYFIEDKFNGSTQDSLLKPAGTKVASTSGH